MTQEMAGAWPLVIKIKALMRDLDKHWLRLVDARLSIVPVTLGLILLLLPQGSDVVRDLAESANVHLRGGDMFTLPAAITYFRWACFISACVWSGVSAWYWPHLLTRARSPLHEPRWFTWLRRTLGMTPLIAAIITVLLVGDDLRDVWMGLLAFTLVAAALLTFFILRRRRIHRRSASPWYRRPSKLMQPLIVRLGGRQGIGLALGDDAFLIFTVGTSLLMLVLFSLPSIRDEVAVALGSAAIAFGAVGSIVAIVSALVWLLAGARVPVLSIGVLAMLLFSVTNDNHVIPRVDSQLAPRRLTLALAYQQWAHANPNGPIILVATAGGASRAAYWTAAVLRALDDRTHGRFGRQVFAISSVSGGSLAAMGYAAWLAGEHCPYSAPRRLAFDRALYGADHLSPAIAGLLYPDLVQQFLPFPLFPDRAAALSESWESGWSGALGEADSAGAASGCSQNRRDRFGEDFLEIWRGSLFGNQPWVPLVLANGTLVEDGKRVITAPIRIDPLVFEDSHDFISLAHGSVSASTAVLNSARFPLVSPAGAIPVEGGRLHLVDGGYFENGGLETLYDVARYLRATMRATAGPQRPILIVEINNDDEAPRHDLARYPNGMDPSGTAIDSLGVSTPHPQGLAVAPGLTSIVRAFYMTRTSRGVLSAKRLSATRAIGLQDTFRATFNLGPLLSGRRTAMSWTLSHSSRNAIDAALQAMETWMSPRQRQDLAEAQRRYDWPVDCQRLLASQIAAILVGSIVPPEPRCNLHTPEAQWLGLPLVSAGPVPGH
jgi:hypothetical protein